MTDFINDKASDFPVEGEMPSPREGSFCEESSANGSDVSGVSGGISCGDPANQGSRQGECVVLGIATPCGDLGISGSRQEDEQRFTVVRRYTFKLYPNRTQDAALERQTVLLARLWNAALEQRETQWAQQCIRKAKGERKGLGKYDQTKELKFVRAEDPEYAAMSASTLELCIFALDDAFKAFYRRAKAGAGKSSGYPRYKPSKPDGAEWRSYHHDTI